MNADNPLTFPLLSLPEIANDSFWCSFKRSNMYKLFQNKKYLEEIRGWNAVAEDGFSQHETMLFANISTYLRWLQRLWGEAEEEGRRAKEAPEAATLHSSDEKGVATVISSNYISHLAVASPQDCTYMHTWWGGMYDFFNHSHSKPIIRVSMGRKSSVRSIM